MGASAGPVGRPAKRTRPSTDFDSSSGRAVAAESELLAALSGSVMGRSSRSLTNSVLAVTGGTARKAADTWSSGVARGRRRDRRRIALTNRSGFRATACGNAADFRGTTAPRPRQLAAGEREFVHTRRLGTGVQRKTACQGARSSDAIGPSCFARLRQVTATSITAGIHHVDDPQPRIDRNVSVPAVVCASTVAGCPPLPGHDRRIAAGSKMPDSLPRCAA